MIDLVLLVDFFPETLGNVKTLWLHSAGKTSVDASATGKKTKTSVCYRCTFIQTQPRERETHVVVFVLLSYFKPFYTNVMWIFAPIFHI